VSSDMFMTYLNTGFLSVRRPEGIASNMIHEAAHLADWLPNLQGDQPCSLGWYAEALAVVTVDMAARMAFGMERQAPFARLDLDPGVPNSQLAWSPQVASANLSPWGNLDDTDLNPAAYDRGARILRHAMER